jgi:uncharacterized membrane protein YjgN (DUF898 family)
MANIPPGMGYQGYPQQRADHPQAVLILVLGILSLVLCSLLGPVAWVMGRRALAEIDQSGGQLGGRSMVLAGYICGIIGSAVIIIAVVTLVVLLIVSLVATGTS